MVGLVGLGASLDNFRLFDMSKSKIWRCVIASMLLLSLILVEFPVNASGETLQTFSDGSAEKIIIKFPDNSTTIMMPNNSFAVCARMNVTSAQGDTPDSYPYSPYVDIGNDSVYEYRYNGTGYGKMGLQTMFSDGNTTQTFNIRKGEEVSTSVLLPYNSTISEVTFDVRGWTPIDFQKENLTMEGFTNIVGHALDPFLVTYKGELYVLWSTNVTTISDGGKDFDLMFRKYNDTSYPAVQLNLRDTAYDDTDSYACEYNGKLYVAWVRYWTGTQRSDIMLAVYDGYYWTEQRMMSPNGYSDNDGVELIVYKNKLYMFWRTNDPTIRDVYDAENNNEDRNLDFVYRVCDETGTWSSTYEFDYGIEDNFIGTGGKYWSFDLEVCFDKLFIVFDTDITKYSSPTTGTDYEIVVKSFDGTAWSAGTRISRTGDYAYDQIPKLTLFDNPITGKQELYAVWITDMLNGSDGPNAEKNNYRDDIVYSVYNGAYWSEVRWISPREDWYTDCYPSVIQFNGLLYVIWVHGLDVNISTSQQSYGATYSIRGDIYLRVYDGLGWQPIRELTNGTNIDNASSPGLFIHENTLYAIWDQWWGQAGNIVPMKLAAFKVVSNITFGDAKWSSSLEGLSSTPKSVSMVPALVKVKEKIVSTKIDEFGNEMCEINFTVSADENATILITELRIRYNYTATIWNFSRNLNTYMRTHKPISSEGRVDAVYRIPIVVSANSSGKIILHDLFIEYHVNLPPSSANIPDMFMLEDVDAPNLLNLSDYFTDDFDNGSLKYIIACDNQEVIRFVEDSGVLGVFITKANWYGLVNFTVIAIDSMGLRSNASVFRLEILSVNDPPIYLNKLKDVKIRVGKSWTACLDEHFYDLEGDIAYYTCSHSEIIYDATSHIVRWSPTHRSKSLHNVTFTAFERGADPNYNVSSIPINLLVVPLDSSAETCGCLPGLILILIVVGFALAFYIGRKFKKDEFDMDMYESYELDSLKNNLQNIEGTESKTENNRE